MHPMCTFVLTYFLLDLLEMLLSLPKESMLENRPKIFINAAYIFDAFAQFGTICTILKP